MRPLRSKKKAAPGRTASEVVEAQPEDVVNEAIPLAKVAEEEGFTERQGPVLIGLKLSVDKDKSSGRRTARDADREGTNGRNCSYVSIRFVSTILL